MKRILHIISQYPGKTGSGTYLQALISESYKKGNKQAVVAALPLGEQYKNRYIDEFYPIVFNSKELPFPIVGMSDIMPYESTKYCDMTEDMMDKWESEFYRVIEEAIIKFKPDLIITHHLWLSTAIVTELAKDIKTVGICHGTDIRQMLKCPQYNDKVINGCGKLDLVLSLNIIQNDQIHSLYNINSDNIKVVGGGYNKDIFYSSTKIPEHEKIRIIYAGKLSFAKGVVSLINVFNILKNEYNIELYVAGSGTGDEEMYIKSIGNDKDIYFLGEVPQSRLGELFRDSDIFILPSFYEGLSLVTLEALASGLLVVVSQIPGLKSFLGADIVHSGAIEFVPMPEMIDVDRPDAEGLNQFNLQLKNGLETQIKRYLNGFKINEKLLRTIESKSWENIYNQIESYL